MNPDDEAEFWKHARAFDRVYEWNGPLMQASWAVLLAGPVDFLFWLVVDCEVPIARLLGWMVTVVGMMVAQEVMVAVCRRHMRRMQRARDRLGAKGPPCR